METDKLDEVIREIAVKNGIAVGRNDPVLIIYTLHERLLKNSVAAQQEVLRSFQEELEAVAHRWGEDAKSKAERTLNAALAASREVMVKTIQDGAEAAAKAMQRESETVIMQTRRVAIMNLVAAGLVVFAAGLVVWANM